MAKPTAPKNRSVQLDKSAEAELRSRLQWRRDSKTPRPIPYLKSFIMDKEPTEINGSILKYTACSSKKWMAPAARQSKRRVMA